MKEQEELYLTKDSFDKLQEELEELVSEKRSEVAEKIKEAKSFGDLSENSEYEAAKNEQAEIEARISKIEADLKRAVLIEEANSKTGIVSIGDTLVLHDYDFEEEVVYTILGVLEADPFEGKISNLSPIGKALMGKKVGNTVEVETPEGKSKYKIKKIEKAKK